MKTTAHIVTVVAAGTVALVLALLAPAAPAPAADRRPLDRVRPQYSPGPGDRSPRGGVHVDSHADYHVKGTEPPGAGVDEDRRDARPEPRPDSRWTPGAERYTRPPPQWSR